MVPPTSPVQDKDKTIQLQSAYIQAKTCNLLAVVFAVCGFFVFAALYQRYIAPDVLGALRDVSIIFMVIFPFLPAVLLSFFAKKYEKRYLALMEKQ